jgi:hypothetical protein
LLGVKTQIELLNFGYRTRYGIAIAPNSGRPKQLGFRVQYKEYGDGRNAAD